MASIDYWMLTDAVKALYKLNHADQLTVKGDRAPQHQLQQPEVFLTELNRRTQTDTALAMPCTIEELGTSSNKYLFDPKSMFSSSNTCFHNLEEMSSKKRLLGNNKTKTNTYILCSICNPFEKADALKPTDRTKTVVYGGKTREVNVRSPELYFFNTLGSGYVNHMANCHGVCRGGDAKQPFLGFIPCAKIKQYKLNAVCPYSHNGKPCMLQFEYNFAKGNGFKQYYRHAKSHIVCESEAEEVDSKQGCKAKKYRAGDLFIPLSYADFSDLCVQHGIKKQTFSYVKDARAESLISDVLSRLTPAPTPSPAPFAEFEAVARFSVESVEGDHIEDMMAGIEPLTEPATPVLDPSEQLLNNSQWFMNPKCSPGMSLQDSAAIWEDETAELEMPGLSPAAPFEQAVDDIDAAINKAVAEFDAEPVEPAEVETFDEWFTNTAAESLLSAVESPATLDESTTINMEDFDAMLYQVLESNLKSDSVYVASGPSFFVETMADPFDEGAQWSCNPMVLDA